jgi:glycosyltransferase involved in cell wall biosynthesis
MNVFIIIPAFNEESVIRQVLQSLQSLGYRLIVVDDASDDGTARIAREYTPDVLEHLINRGQGAALKTGITYALQEGAEIIVTYDADGQHQAKDIKALLEPIRKGECEVTLGSRYLMELSQRQVPLARKILHRLAICFTNLTTGLHLTDTHNGLRALTAAAARKIHFKQDRMAHASEILEEIANNRISFKEVPVTIHYTNYSLEKGQKLGDFVKILFKMFVQKLK